MKYDLVLIEKIGIDGLSTKEITDLLLLSKSDKVYPVEFEALTIESSAMGFITSDGAKKIEYEYEKSGLHDFIASVLDGTIKNSENGEYSFNELKIFIRR